jgi:hypothetical protein
MEITRQTTGITLDDFRYGNKKLPVMNALRLFCYKAHGPYCTCREIGDFLHRHRTVIGYHVKTFANLLSTNDPQTVQYNTQFDELFNLDTEEVSP